MTETLVHAYTPLILWTSLGLLVFKLLPKWLPHFLGRGLYWVGVPLELLALARTTHQPELSGAGSIPWLAVVITVGSLLVGLSVALLVLWGWQKFFLSQSQPNLNNFFPPQQGLSSATKGSFVLAAVLGNTGFVGLAIAPYIIHSDAVDWALLFSITHSVIGPYGLGVLIASYFSHAKSNYCWWKQLRDLLTVPPLWAFIIGMLSRNIPLPAVVESGIQGSINIVIACAFLLTGIRVGQLQGWQNFRLALIPAVVKVVIMPLLVGLT